MHDRPIAPPAPRSDDVDARVGAGVLGTSLSRVIFDLEPTGAERRANQSCAVVVQLAWGVHRRNADHVRREGNRLVGEIIHGAARDRSRRSWTRDEGSNRKLQWLSNPAFDILVPTWVYLIIIGVYSAAQIALGLWAARRVRASSDFFVGGRSFGPGLLFATFLAANIGGGSTIGATGLGYRDGLAAWWWVGSTAIGSLILAIWVGPRIRRWQPNTIFERSATSSSGVTTPEFGRRSPYSSGSAL